MKLIQVEYRFDIDGERVGVVTVTTNRTVARVLIEDKNGSHLVSNNVNLDSFGRIDESTAIHLLELLRGT